MGYTRWSRLGPHHPGAFDWGRGLEEEVNAAVGRGIKHVSHQPGSGRSSDCAKPPSTTLPSSAFLDLLFSHDGACCGGCQVLFPLSLVDQEHSSPLLCRLSSRELAVTPPLFSRMGSRHLPMPRIPPSTRPGQLENKRTVLKVLIRTSKPQVTCRGTSRSGGWSCRGSR